MKFSNCEEKLQNSATTNRRFHSKLEKHYHVRHTSCNLPQHGHSPHTPLFQSYNRELYYLLRVNDG